MKKPLLKTGLGLVGVAALGGWLFSVVLHADTPPAQQTTPVSFAEVPWGVASVTNGNANTGVRPAWLTGAERLGGAWLQDGGWHVASEATSGELHLTVDRTSLGMATNLVLDSTVKVPEGGTLHVDLVDANGNVVAANVAQRGATAVVDGVPQAESWSVTLPLAANPQAVAARIVRDSGEVTVSDSLLYVDVQGQPVPPASLVAMHAAGNAVDSDGDLYSDAYETRAGTNPNDPASHPTGSLMLTVPADCLAEKGATGPASTGQATVVSEWSLNPQLGYADGALATANGSLKALYRLDEAYGSLRAADFSGNRYDGVVHGAVAGQSGRISGAFQFNGSQYVDLGNSPSISGAGSFTASAWVKTTATGGFVLSQRDSSGNGYAGGYFLGVYNGKALFQLYSWYYADNRVALSTAAVNDGQWHHILGLRDSTTKTIRLYVDGALVATTAAFGYAMEGTTRTYIGGNLRDNNNFYAGLADDVAVWNRMLSDAEIAEIASLGASGAGVSSRIGKFTRTWTATDGGSSVSKPQAITVRHTQGPSLTLPADGGINANESLDPSRTGRATAGDVADGALKTTYADSGATLLRGLAGLWRLDEAAGTGTTADFSGHGLMGTLSSTTAGVSGQVGTAFQFNGTSSCVSVGAPTALNNLTSCLTVAAWIKPSVVTSGLQQAIFTSGFTNGWALALKGSGLRFTTYGIKDYDFAANIQTGVWTHVAATLDASGTVEFFVNGVSVGKIAGSQGATLCTTGWFIGGIKPASMGWFNGAIDEVGVWRRTLSAPEMAALYAQGAANKAVGPELAATGDTLENGLVAHYEMEEGAGATGVAGKGVTFNGTSSGYARLPAFNLNSNTVTLACWVKRNGSQYQWSGLIFNRSGSTVVGINLLSTGEIRYHWNNASNTYNFATGLVVPDNAWTFVALAVEPSKATVYMDSGAGLVSKVNNVAHAAQAFSGESRLGIDPNGNARYFKGTLDEVGVWNRTLTAAEIARLDTLGRSNATFCGSRSVLTLNRTWSATDSAGNTASGTQKITLSSLWYDTDADGLTDYAEYLAGSNPNAADSDNDGLTDLQEVLLGTDPAKADTDGDGLPDGWEIAHGFNPLNAVDGAADADNDGLSNAGEYAAGTNMNNADTDGDGISDAEEVRIGSNPAVADFGARTVYKEFGLAEFATALGDWILSPDGCLVQMTPRGVLEYTFSSDTDPGILQVELEIRQFEAIVPQNLMPLQLYIDGMLVAQHDIVLQQGAAVTDRFVLPNLKAGTHTIRLSNDNVYMNHRPGFAAIRLVRYGAAATGQDWVQNRLGALYGIVPASVASKTSPFCLEGKGPYTQLMKVNGAASAKVSGYRCWYADVPLSKTGPTSVEVSFENDAIRKTATVTWEETNVLDNGSATIRKGDALLLAARVASDASAPGTFSLAVDGQPCAATGTDAVEYHFNTAGAHAVTATHTAANGAVTQGTLTVNVVSVEPPADPLVLWTMRDCRFSWPGLPPEAVMVGRSFHYFETVGPGLFCLRREEYAEQIPLVVRLGDIAGPILLAIPSYSVWLTELPEGYYTDFVTFDDGSVLYNVPLYIGGQIPPGGLRLKIYTLAGGVMFGDGSSSIWLNSADFNALGIYNLQLQTSPSRSGGPCHRIEIYDGNIYIGTRR